MFENLFNGLKQVVEELRLLREDIGTLTSYVKGRKQDPFIKTPELARRCGYTDVKKFRKERVGVDIWPVKDKKSVFHRKDGEMLARKCEQLRLSRGVNSL